MSSRSALQSQAGVAKKEATLTTGLAVVLRGQPRIAALQHVVHALDDLVDVSCQWSISRACALESQDPSSYDGGARRLVARVVARRPLEDMDAFYRQAQLSGGLVNAAERGNEELVHWLLENIVMERFTVDSHSCIFKAAEAASSGGHQQVLEEVLKHDKRGITIKPAMISAARGNNLGVLKWLYERFTPSNALNDCASALLEAAAGVGNIDMASWLVEIVGADCLRLSVASAAQNAISGGHLNMVESLVDIASTIDGPFCLDGAAGRGYLQAVQWGLQHGGACTAQAMNSAASSGHLEVVKWLHDHRTDDGCTTQAMDNAASHGHLSVVQWLHSHRQEGCTTEAMDGAATHGHLDVVQWLHRYRSEGCTIAAMNGAAKENHLDVLQWLHGHRSEGCTQEALDGAASGGNVVVMQWLIGHCPEKCSFSRFALENAAASGQLEAVQWLFKQRSADTSEWIACDAMDQAASGGHLTVVKWLHDRRREVGSCSSAAMDGAASNGHLEMVKWLHSERREGATYRAMDGAAAGGHLEILMFLYANRSDGCTSDAAVKAALNEHVEVVQWLLQRYPQQSSHEKVRKFAARYNFSLLDQCNRSHILPAGAY